MPSHGVNLGKTRSSVGLKLSLLNQWIHIP
jgi:hypothetical protein